MKYSLKDNKKLYEYPEYWEATTLDEHMHNKLNIMLSIIPQDVKKILDLGCGHGITTNILAQKYHVTGVERSKYALSHVTCQKKINCQIQDIHFTPESFDLILLSEVLEHLSEDDFPYIIRQIKELMASYILVSVPNSETLRKRYVKCNQCGHEFNAYYHFRSFNKLKLQNLFYEYDLIFYTICGKPYEYYNDLLSYIKQIFGNGWFSTDEKFLCPVCENEEDLKKDPNFIAALCDKSNWIYQSLFGKISSPYWQIALFKKK